MSHDAHLRQKAIELRTEKHMTLEQIVERLQLPKTTIYGWIKEIPIPKTEKQSERQRNMTEKMKAKYKALRDDAYQQGWNEAPTLIQESSFRDFVVLYIAEGFKRNRNAVSLGNSDSAIVKLCLRWVAKFTRKKITYQLQRHIDQDEGELRSYWSQVLNIRPEEIKITRKSNSGQLAKRNFRSVYGVLSFRTDDTYLRARLQAWIDFVKQQW
jgi:hypothetical protein